MFSDTLTELFLLHLNEQIFNVQLFVIQLAQLFDTQGFVTEKIVLNEDIEIEMSYHSAEKKRAIQPYYFLLKMCTYT